MADLNSLMNLLFLGGAQSVSTDLGLYRVKVPSLEKFLDGLGLPSLGLGLPQLNFPPLNELNLATIGTLPIPLLVNLGEELKLPSLSELDLLGLLDLPSRVKLGEKFNFDSLPITRRLDLSDLMSLSLASIKDLELQ